MQQPNAAHTLPTDNALEIFLRHFNYNQVTVSIQPEKGALNQRLKQGHFFSPSTVVRAIPVNQITEPSVIEELQDCNSKGHAVYFTVNEGNGKAVDSTLNCGKIENITKLKALIIDTDTAPFKEVRDALTALKFYPHLIVNSSPERYHLYFLLEDTPVTSETRRLWESLQKRLCDIHPKVDKGMIKINQLLRLPEFFHQKKEPFRVKLVQDFTARVEKYNLKKEYERLGAHKFDEDLQYVNGEYVNGTYSDKPKYELPKTKIKEGGRHAELLKFTGHFIGNFCKLETPDSYIKPVIEDHAKGYLDKSYEFLEGGERAGEIPKIIKDVKKKRQRDEARRLAFAENQKFEEIENKKEETRPDSFYLNFPGDLGVITKFIHNTHPNLSLELCFAGALCFSGAIKADVLKCKTCRPFVNGFVLAPTGTGKSSLIKIIEQLCYAAGLKGEYSQILEHPASVQALHEDLYRAGGFGTLIIDEAGDYMQAMNLKSNSGYNKMVRPYLKKATSTSDGMGTTLHPGRSKNNTDPAFIGMLSVWMFSQPSMFYSSIDANSMSDGFIPRFFIFKGEGKYDFTSYVEGRSGGTVEVPLEIRVIIEGLNNIKKKIDYAEVDEEISKELEGKDKKEAKKWKKEEMKLAMLYEIKHMGRLSNTKEVVFTPEAERILLDYLEAGGKDLISLRKEKGEGTPEEDLMVRTEEMVLRLICNAASWDGEKAVADCDIVEKCIEFYAFQRRRFLEGEAAELYKTWAEKQSDIVYKAVVKAKEKYKENCTIGQIVTCITADKRPDNLDKVLWYLETCGKISSFTRKHKVTKKDIKTYGPPMKEDEENLPMEELL